MDLKIFESQILKTGFVLENKVAVALKQAGWTVISNKFYVDDHEGSIREMDLIGYKCRRVAHINLYTVLVVSCKKSEANVWGLFTREANLSDPNTDWWPLHAWSNDKAINFQLTKPNAAKQFHEKAATSGVNETVAQPTLEVFAFQELDRKTGAPQNDKPIFSAITSLMKAQAYELGALPHRKKDPSVYQFNLVSVVDTDLVRLFFNGTSISASSIDSENYLARYIIKKKETFSRIRFLQAEAFESSIADYDRLHESNAKWVSELDSTFYHDVVRDHRRVEVFSKEFKESLLWYLNYSAKQKFHNDPKFESIWFYWEENSEFLSLQLNAEESVIEFLNSDVKLKAKTKEALQKFYRYSGKFEYAVDDIPF
jgi:hypothetical protein